MKNPGLMSYKSQTVPFLYILLFISYTFDIFMGSKGREVLSLCFCSLRLKVKIQLRCIACRSSHELGEYKMGFFLF